MRASTLILMAWLTCSAAVTQAAGPVRFVKVDVQCTADDSIGNRLCSVLKEKIRGSKGFQLVDTREAETDVRGFGVHLVSVPITAEGKSMGAAAVAVAFTRPQLGSYDSYISLFVRVCPDDNIEGVATDILADIDRMSHFLREWSN
jgi:hypothetical protein